MTAARIPGFLIVVVAIAMGMPNAQGAEFYGLSDAAPSVPGDSSYASAEELPMADWDREGLRRDTAYFMGYQVVAVAILYAMPESVTNWTEEDKSDYSASKWWQNVTSPQIDSDDFYLNYITHPYWGGAYFVRGRERGLNNTQAFWYSALLSALFEFGAEALAEEPSYQDLVATPVLGSMVGVWFMQLREGVEDRDLARGYRSTGDKWIMVLTDPLGGLNRQVDKLFGRDVDVMLTPYMSQQSLPGQRFHGEFSSRDEFVYGLNLRINW